MSTTDRATLKTRAAKGYGLMSAQDIIDSLPAYNEHWCVTCDHARVDHMAGRCMICTCDLS